MSHSNGIIGEIEENMVDEYSLAKANDKLEKGNRPR